METTENWTGFTSVETQDFYEGSASLKRIGSWEGWSVKYIKVDPEKRYRLSGCFKSVGSGGLSPIYFGLQSYDSNFRSIGPSFSNSIVASRTILSKNLSIGDLTVEVDDVSGWGITPDWYRFIGVYPFEEYPDYTYTRNIYDYSGIDYQNNVITLQNPYSGPNLPAGTKVSQNRGDYGSYTYSVIRGSNIPNSWSCYSSEIYGQNVPVIGWDQFRYGTKYIKILMLLNSGRNTDYSVLVDNVKFEMIANE